MEKGGQLKIFGAISQNGFVPNASLILESKATKDYHDEIDDFDDGEQY